MPRSIALLLILISTGACSSLPSVTDDPDYALCQQARAQALRGDPAAEATLDRMRELRNASYCRNDLMIRDRGIPPDGT